MPNDSAWSKALSTHEAALAEFRAQVARVPPASWHAPAAEGKWSPAEEALHVALAYEVALVNLGGGPGMRLRVSPPRSALLRWFLLPWLLHTGKFPRGVPAPREIRPPREEVHGLTTAGLLARLEHAAAAAAAALRAAEARRPQIRLAHAYFGALPPLVALRLLSAHTRHHAGHLAMQNAIAGDG